MNDTELYKCYINNLFHDVSWPSREKHASITETYGEVLYPSVNKLISSISLHEDDVFYDLGSGLGKLAIQVFLKTNIKVVHGIEIRHDLYRIALRAEKRIQADLPAFYQNDRKLIFTHGDFLNMNYSNASVILIASPCFSMSMFETLAQRIHTLKSIRYVVSLKPMLGLQQFRFAKTVSLECSWDTALCYIYQKRP